ncbi:MAG TPA: LemA family protein [Chitinophagaceae bacterium]|nr:LemA family protein [Chitinophagaceae bacterium]
MRNKTWVVLLSILALIVIYSLVTYNSLIKREEKVKQKWGDLQTTYQRRNDLIPNLVSVVKGSSEYEKNVLTQVAEARARATNFSVSGDVSFQNFQQLEQLQAEVANSTNRALAVVENYPDIKAQKSFSALQTQLVGTERRIKVARADFNQAVAEYNKKARSFPSNLVAKLTGFEPKDGFRADAGAEQAPEINFQQQ